MPRPTNVVQQTEKHYTKYTTIGKRIPSKPKTNNANVNSSALMRDLFQFCIHDTVHIRYKIQTVL